MREIINAEVEPVTINDLPRTGRITKGKIYRPGSNDEIKAKNGIVMEKGDNGGKCIVLKGEEFPGEAFIDGIRFA